MDITKKKFIETKGIGLQHFEEVRCNSKQTRETQTTHQVTKNTGWHIDRNSKSFLFLMKRKIDFSVRSHVKKIN